MTNLERIRSMGQFEMATFLNEVRTSSVYRYVNVQAWLDSENRMFPFSGPSAVYVKDGAFLPCHVVSNNPQRLDPDSIVEIVYRDPAATMSTPEFSAYTLASVKNSEIYRGPFVEELSHAMALGKTYDDMASSPVAVPAGAPSVGDSQDSQSPQDI